MDHAMFIPAHADLLNQLAPSHAPHATAMHQGPSIEICVHTSLSKSPTLVINHARGLAR